MKADKDRILEALGPGWCGVARLSAATGMARPKLYRLLAEMRGAGLVRIGTVGPAWAVCRVGK